MSESNTHSVTTPNKKPAMAIDAFKAHLVTDYQKQVTNYFSGNKEKSMKFMSAVVHSVQKVPGLLECDRTSLMNAFMACAEYELYPSNVSGEAYVLPYKGKAQFQLGYQGIITLLYRAGIESIHTNLVFENDTFEYEEGLDSKLVHKPTIFGKSKGKVVGVYAIASVNGQKLFKVMSRDEVMKFREFSQSKSSEYSPWNEKNDPEGWMLRKTCIKQLAKILPKNDSLMRAVEKDNQDSVIAAQRGSMDAGGLAVGRALHSAPSPEEEAAILAAEKKEGHE